MLIIYLDKHKKMSKEKQHSRTYYIGLAIHFSTDFLLELNGVNYLSFFVVFKLTLNFQIFMQKKGCF